MRCFVSTLTVFGVQSAFAFGAGPLEAPERRSSRLAPWGALCSRPAPFCLQRGGVACGWPPSSIAPFFPRS